MSFNAVNQTTGDLTPIAGNATDKVGNLSALTTTDKSSAVAAINEVNERLTANTVGLDVSVRGSQGYTFPNDGYLRLINNSSTSGKAELNVGGRYLLRINYDKLGATDVHSVFVKKGMTFTDSSTLNDYYLNYDAIT